MALLPIVASEAVDQDAATVARAEPDRQASVFRRMLRAGRKDLGADHLAAKGKRNGMEIELTHANLPQPRCHGSHSVPVRLGRIPVTASCSTGDRITWPSDRRVRRSISLGAQGLHPRSR